ncbi:MAG: hypothetical protein A2Z72_00510 [Omnitrophica bacterium RBG_13_46_9]|nr:MAG: hypothetical protein A2Z72_00510 [Omnitrophica bacterium RBG_13_46_9]
MRLLKKIYAFFHTIKKQIIVYSEVTTYCTNNCFFCAKEKANRGGYIRPQVEDKIKEFLKHFPDKKFKVYFHLLGESMLYKGLEVYVRRLSMANVELWMSTNGQFLNEENLLKLWSAGLRNVWFTFHYTNEADYKKHTRCNNFHIVRDNLYTLLSKSRLFKRIHIVTFSADATEIEKAIRYKLNVTLAKNRTTIPWQYSPPEIEKQICVSINGDITFSYKDYNFEHSIGNICDLPNEEIMKKYSECAIR